MNFGELREQHRPWAERNFGAANPDHAVLGVAEELGEYVDACFEQQRGKAIDALGDMVIFLADFVRGVPEAGDGLVLGYYGQPAARIGGTAIEALAIAVGQLAHAHLKSRQGIRGSAEERMNKVRRAVEQLHETIHAACIMHGLTIEETIAITWAEVSKRDWRAAPVTGQAT